MIIYPAIDIANGKCVRLLQGERNRKTVYNNNPSEVAARWEAEGANWVHLVDLDSAFDGESLNYSAIKKIISTVRIPLQLGGGIRSMEAIEKFLEAGISRVIIGTAAVKDPALLAQAIEKYGSEKIAVGIDAKNGKVAIKGWVEETNMTPVGLGLKMKTLGVTTFIVTDILKDGMLTGPNTGSLSEFGRTVGCEVIASGGIATIDDIQEVAKRRSDGISGIITGKALYENKFTLGEAIAAANN